MYLAIRALLEPCIIIPARPFLILPCPTPWGCCFLSLGDAAVDFVCATVSGWSFHPQRPHPFYFDTCAMPHPLDPASSDQYGAQQYRCDAVVHGLSIERGLDVGGFVLESGEQVPPAVFRRRSVWAQVQTGDGHS